MELETRQLTTRLWPSLQRLFGARGACGGCWCMAWRIGRGEKWDEVKGETARRRMRKLVSQGRARGLLAFEGGEPVGWCTFGPRSDFPRLERARTLRCDDAGRVWSIPCFFIARGWRGRGVAGTLLEHAIELMRSEGAPIVEGYPAKPPRDGGALPGAFAWTGTPSLFEARGFTLVGSPSASKLRMRLRLG
jgi:GNAT superfamily N-acetyltransferase